MVSAPELPLQVTASLELARDAAARGDRAAAERALREALCAVSFPTTFPDVVYPLVETLTPEQRRVAELIAEMPVSAPWEWMPGKKTVRRWLGLEPPGPLETLIDHDGARIPVWRALHVVDPGPGTRGPTSRALLASLPIPLRLGVLATLGGAALAYRVDSDVWGAWEIASALGAEGREWALAHLAAAPQRSLEEVHGSSALGEQLAFFALVRAGHPIDPSWDHYLPIGADVPPAIARECASALPLERLERVGPALLEKTHGHFAIRLGLAILERHDSGAIARFVWQTSERSSPHNRDAERKALLGLAETRPAVEGALAKLRASAPKKPARQRVAKKPTAKATAKKSR